MNMFVKSSKWLMITLGCCFSFLLVTSQPCTAKTLAKVTLNAEGTSTGLPDLFSGTMSYSIPIEVPAGRKGMDPGLALNYRSGSGNGALGVGWELELGSIQRATTSGTVNFSGDNYLLTKTGSASSLFSVGTNSYQTKIEGGFSRIQQISTANGPYWVVTDKAGVRFYYGQTAASRQDDSGSISRIYKWNLDRIEDTNGNYIAIYYYKNQNQIYLDRIEYTGNTGLDPTNVVNFYWEARLELVSDSSVGFTVKTAYRLATIDVVAKPTSTTTNRIRAYKLTYSNGPISHGSLLSSVQHFDKDSQVPAKSAGIASSGQVTGGDSLPARTMIYDQTGTQSNDYLTSFSNGIGGTTTIAYTAATLSGTIDTVQNVSSVAVSDGNGNTSTTYYHYTGGYYFASENDFRGFNKVEVRGPISADGKQVRTETYFHQGNETAADANNPAVPTGFTKGKPYRSITYAISGVTTGNEEVGSSQKLKISETTTSYAQKSINPPYFTPPNQIDTYLYDGNTNYRQSRAVYDYDAYGNVTYEEFQGDVNDANDRTKRTTRRSYLYNTDKWLVVFPITEGVYDGVNSWKKVAFSDFFYDEFSSCTADSPSNFHQAPVKGNLTRVTRWFDTSLAVNPPYTRTEQRMGYDSYGNIACTRDPNSSNIYNGKLSAISYDNTYTFPILNTNVLGQLTTIQYYGVNGISADKGFYGQIKSVTDPNGAVTTKEYDGFGRPQKVTSPDNTWTSRSYYNFGTVASQYVRMNTSDGLWSENYFDGLGRTYLTKAKGPDSKTIAANTLYDARGAVRKTSLPYFYAQETPRYLLTDYDAVGRVVRSGLESPADYIRSLTCYDKDVTVKIDPNNHRRREVRDSSGRLIKVQEFKGAFSSCSTEEGTPYGTTTYQYDVLGNLRFVTDAKGNQTEMRYDTLGRKIYMRDPDMGVWNYTYDANGNLKTQTDAKYQTITFDYDELNRLTTKKHGASLVLSNYYDEAPSSNSKGRLSRMVDTFGQTVYNYDNMGRAISTVKNIDGIAYNLGFSFLDGRLNSITYPDNETVNYSYDAGYLNGVTGYAGYLNFDAMGRAKNASYGGGASSLYTFYTDTQRLHTLTVASQNQGILIDNIYSYDNKGNVTSITDNLNKTLPTNIPSESYTLDTSRAHAVASLSSGKTYTYDANGNITAAGQQNITYDYDNMPTTIGTASFTYDGNGTRIKKSSPASTTTYINKLYECTNGACTKYIFAGNERIASKSGQVVLYYHPDHQGSTSVVTNASGAAEEKIAYYPFGGTRTDDGGIINLKHKYTSQELDSETGLYNYNARIYDPDLGRFLTPDTIVPDPTNPQSLNRYSYVLNNPLNYTDPTGHSLRSGWRRFRSWWNENVDTDVNVGLGSVGGNTGGSYNVSIGPASTPLGNSSATSASSNTATATNYNAAQGISINIYNNGEFASADNIYSQLSNSLGNYSGSARLSLAYGGLVRSVGMISSSGFAGNVSTASVGGFNGTQFIKSSAGAAATALSGAGNALVDMAKNGPPAAQATLGFAALTVAVPTAYAVGQYALSGGLIYAPHLIDTANSLGLPPSQPPSIFQGVTSLYSLYDDWMSYRAK